MVCTSDMTRHIKHILRVVLICAVLMSGCGYHLARYANPMLDDIDTVAVPYFSNRTFEPEAETIFTTAFVNEFVEGRRLEVVRPADADVVLRGTIRKLQEETIAFNRDDKALEYRIHAVLDVVLEKRLSGEVLWKRKSLYHSEEFLVSDDIIFSEAAKRAALQRLADDLAERVHDSIMQGF